MTITIINLSKPINELKNHVTNWNELSDQVKTELLKGEYFTVPNYQSLLIYQGKQCIIDCMTNYHLLGQVELLNGYNNEGKIF